MSDFFKIIWAQTEGDRAMRAFLAFISASILAFLVWVWFKAFIFRPKYISQKSESELKTDTTASGGGKGGNASVSGNNSTAIGGKGGKGGTGGKGGDGGDAEVFGDSGFAMGGEGGEAGQGDRGGAGGRSPLEILKEMGRYNAVDEYLEYYSKLRLKYAQDFGLADPPNILPEDWVNEHLKKAKMSWRVKNTDNGYNIIQVK